MNLLKTGFDEGVTKPVEIEKDLGMRVLKKQ